jgi:ribosomal protein S18
MILIWTAKKVDADADAAVKAKAKMTAAIAEAAEKTPPSRAARFVSSALIKTRRLTTKTRRFVTDRGKMIPRRITGVCAKHQRQLALSIKRARNIALMPFTVTGR